uniref:Movement protein n=1 Tax=Cowpea polerovirus 2 TaxID=1913125 RepID=A0A8F7GPF0_9VIRU|nr:movement protein [Cowpea polerovirus 2]QXU64020.1 movement protein [Cowpea polerovirus 2]
MEGELGVADAFKGVSAWLWSRPLGYHVAEEDNDETAELLQEEADLEEGRATHLCFHRTASKAVTPDISRSGRLFQRSQSSVMEFSGPTMSIRSQWSSWGSSPRPLQPPRVQSLSNWIPIASTVPYNHRLTNSELSKGEIELGTPVKSTGLNGTMRPKINSGYFTRETEAPRLRGPSGLPSGASSRTPNR